MIMFYTVLCSGSRKSTEFLTPFCKNGNCAPNAEVKNKTKKDQFSPSFTKARSVIFPNSFQLNPTLRGNPGLPKTFP